MSTNTGTAILNRLLEPENGDLPPQTARYILRLDFSKKDHRRMKQLSARASEGSLSQEEREELEEYLRISDLLALWQSKARRSLQRTKVGF